MRAISKEQCEKKQISQQRGEGGEEATENVNSYFRNLGCKGGGEG
jgi:hypothetical protein